MSAERIQTLLDSAGIAVDKYWPGLFADMIKEMPVQQLIGDGMLFLFVSLSLCLTHTLYIACKGGGGGSGGGEEEEEKGGEEVEKEKTPEKEDTPTASSVSGPGLFSEGSSSSEEESESE